MQADGPDFLIALDPPAPGIHVYEPHVAIDPANPDRIAVAAQYGIRGGRAARNLQLWVSEDAGRTWFSTRVPRPKFDGGFTADPLVAFHTDGSILVVGDCAHAELAAYNDMASYTRMTAPSYSQIRVGPKDLKPIDIGLLDSTSIGVSRSEDGGRTLSGTIIPGISPSADKSSIAVDRSPASPHKGSVYISWWDKIPSLRIGRSRDGGRTFASPFQIPTWSAAPTQQIATLPDGSVHLLWTLGGAPGFTGGTFARDDTPPDADKFVYHAISTDGGVTFSPPVTVARHAGVGKVSIPTLAVDAYGHLLFVWGQTEHLPDLEARPLVQARHRLFGICRDTTAQWSAPFELCPDIPTNTHMGLPALACDGKTWWLLAYRANDEQTQVVLLRSDNGGATFCHDRTLARRAIRFRPDRKLAERPFPVDEISLMGTHLLRFCDEIPQIGDYVGVAAVGQRVAAAFVLPETDAPASRATAYVAIADAPH